ncbi:MAG: PhpK family radical SAM P-methyltransferase [Candidatus Aminicenantes bacterium]|jgi:radical SAM PhpK family P-methyltransferase
MNKDKICHCLLIGYNELCADEFEGKLRTMGLHSGAYRDFNLNFIRYDNRPYSISEIFNLFYCSDTGPEAPNKPLRIGETFSAAIAYLGTWLDSEGLTFDYINSFRDEQDRLKQKLEKENILTIAVITTLYVSVFPIIEIVEFCRRYNHTAKIIVGGPYISTQFRTMESQALQYLLESTIGADVYVNSPHGEAALVNIINALKNNFPLYHVNNIYYKTDDGYVLTSQLPEIHKLTDNMVNWQLFSDRIGEYANVRTAISCPFSCAFCGFPQHAGKYQTAELVDIERELNTLDKIGEITSVFFIDDTFNVPIERFRNILRMLIRNKYQFKWHSYFRCQFADKEMVELMKDSGCEGVFLGIESGNQGVLKNMNKFANLDKYREGIALLKENSIVTYGNFIVGFPGETEKTVRDTIDFIQTSGLDFYRAQLWYCEPITPIWQERIKYRLKGKSFEWSHVTMDAKKACDLIEEMFLSIDSPIWVPQYHFDFDNLWHLTNRGMSLQQVKELLRIFNRGVREKLNAPTLNDVSMSIIKELTAVHRSPHEETALVDNRINSIDENLAEFDL